MNSIQDALSEALDHPLEYHPDRPRPLAKKSERPMISESSLWAIIGGCLGLGVALLAYSRGQK